MKDSDFIPKIAKLWIELGGDAEGVAWTWKKLQAEVDRQQNNSEEEDDESISSL